MVSSPTNVSLATTGYAHQSGSLTCRLTLSRLSPYKDKKSLYPLAQTAKNNRVATAHRYKCKTPIQKQTEKPLPPTQRQKKKGYDLSYPFSGCGSDSISRSASRQVPWALKGFTSVFGMRTGVSPSLLPPQWLSMFPHTHNCIEPFSAPLVRLFFSVY